MGSPARRRARIQRPPPGLEHLSYYDESPPRNTHLQGAADCDPASRDRNRRSLRGTSVAGAEGDHIDVTVSWVDDVDWPKAWRLPPGRRDGVRGGRVGPGTNPRRQAGGRVRRVLVRGLQVARSRFRATRRPCDAGHSWLRAIRPSARRRTSAVRPPWRSHLVGWAASRGAVQALAAGV